MTFTVGRNGATLGSFSEQEVSDGIASGRFLPSDMGWCETMTDWQPLASIPAFRTGGGRMPPPLPPNAADFGMPRTSKPMGEDPAMRWLMPVGRSGWAIAAGYLGLFGLIIFPAPIALIVSIIAIWHIKKSKSTGKPLHGMGRAIFGLIVGILGTAALVVFAVAGAFSHR